MTGCPKKLTMKKKNNEQKSLLNQFFTDTKHDFIF